MSGKKPQIVRKIVLLPGELLPPAHRCAGKHHGVVLRIEPPAGGPGGGGYPTAVVQMTDFTDGGRTKKLKVQLPLETVLPYVVGKQARQRQPKRLSAAEEEKLLGINYEIERWPALDRERAPKKAKRTADDPPLHGPQLMQRLQELQDALPLDHFPPGTRVWVRVLGSGQWPAVAWSFGLCKRRDWGQLMVSHRPGMLLVRYYGEHSNMWVRTEDCEVPPTDESEHVRQLRSVGRAQNKLRLLELALSEMEGAHADPELERRRMLHLYEQYLQTRQAPDNCYLCRELGADLECVCCDRLFHPLCLHYPAVSGAELPGRLWTCPCCGEEQQVGEGRGGGGEAGEGDEGGEGGAEVERMGLTPDWIIEAASFRVFQLPRPTAEQPYIAGLLDPCTNSKLAPNIPAQVLFDKQDNGLKLSNSWAGHYVLLNPDYRAQVQWRFVNRAIDEVENGAVPGVVLVCRNSTDTGYFQRLRPYPRVLLRRLSARFKDYDKTPIGFGIAVFCIAPKSSAKALYSRFHDAFESMGEPNIPLDKQMMQTDAFYLLLDRLREYASQHHRDHWVQCSACSKWRIVDFQASLGIEEDSEWRCSMLRPPFTSCQTPLSKNELVGGHYAAGSIDWAASGDEEGEEGGVADAAGRAVSAAAEAAGGAGGTTAAEQAAALQQVSAGQPPLPHGLQELAAQPVQPAQRPSRLPPLPPPAPLPALPNPLPPASEVVCPATLQELVRLPPRNMSLDTEEEGEGAGQVLTALELARQARIAANRAYLAGLGLGPQAMNCGQVAALPPDDPVVLAAARELASRAAAEQGRQQMEEVRRRYDTARRRRQREEPRLLRALREIQGDESAAWQQLLAAEQAAGDLQREEELHAAVARI
ncbi:DNA N-6-adenine-methyltransferase (Dam) [Micractinium conductrix]|uniref:DNA N-6-adenine-methyltransferase (Dam) n=1 Tax=Micractinium conductrix TaxID=554055 RepID=A0A2P6VH96_9CHLO|nr:DNA N-6-adenine-methyltransferase (Dam) [Micractinium conductrix]|eukprot:PSC73461.1 DNA N-6-adenine-methyltransferase (Dam) [Micractinium conductrix]